jgi:hypothetical protein
MSLLKTILSLAVGAALSAQGTLDLSPSQPKVGQMVTFSLRTPTPPASVQWNFGDGTHPVDGGIVTTYAFRKPGSFTVQATYQVGGALAQAQRLVAVSDGRTIRFSPVTPITGASVTFTAVGFISPVVRWSFGDGSVEPAGTPVQAHVYTSPGSFQVRAQDGPDGAQQVFTTSVTVLGQGPAAPFTISYLALRWAEGTTDVSVPRDAPGLAAYADLKIEGTGILQAQWLVDGRPFRSFSLPLGFAQRFTLGSGSPAPLQGFGPGALPSGLESGLPTNLPGEHLVTLQILGQTLGFEVPVLRYFVTVAAPDLPDITVAEPESARRGQELDVVLTGRHFREDMGLVLGRDLAQVSPIVVQSATRASVRIYVSPTAKPGPRSLQFSLGRKRLPATAKLKILAAP